MARKSRRLSSPRHRTRQGERREPALAGGSGGGAEAAGPLRVRSGVVVQDHWHSNWIGRGSPRRIGDGDRDVTGIARGAKAFDNDYQPLAVYQAIARIAHLP